jgi:hypothetical protein
MNQIAVLIPVGRDVLGEEDREGDVDGRVLGQPDSLPRRPPEEEVPVGAMGDGAEAQGGGAAGVQRGRERFARLQPVDVRHDRRDHVAALRDGAGRAEGMEADHVIVVGRQVGDPQIVERTRPRCRRRRRRRARRRRGRSDVAR